MISSTLTGALLSKAACARVAELEKSRVFIAHIRLRIRYAANDFDALTASYAKENAGLLPLYFNAGSEESPGLSRQKILIEGLERPEVKSVLKAEDRTCLASFFSELGKADARGETALCDLYEALIEERLNAAKLHAEQYSGIYTVLGAFTGLAAVVLFF